MPALSPKFRPLILGGVYRHFRTKTHYRVVCSAIHTETKEDLVVYVEADAIEPYVRVWARPRSSFLGFVDYEEATVKRFTLQGWEALEALHDATKQKVRKASGLFRGLLQRLLRKGEP